MSEALVGGIIGGLGSLLIGHLLLKRKRQPPMMEHSVLGLYFAVAALTARLYNRLPVELRREFAGEIERVAKNFNVIGGALRMVRTADNDWVIERPDDDHRQRCKACWHADGFDFDVPDEVWRSVVPPELQHLEICLRCFDDFARERGIDYSGHLDTLYFAGDQVAFEFRKISGASGGLGVDTIPAAGL